MNFHGGYNIRDLFKVQA